jgi:iron complex transport system substrate-binding protein
MPTPRAREHIFYFQVMRIASLVPSSTEMLFALGLGDQVVAVTHECDWPREATSIPHLTRTVIPDGLSAAEIDRTVRETVDNGRPLYELDADRLAELEPDLIVTQAVCDVCAVSYEDVVAVAASLRGKPRVLSLDPVRLDEVIADFGRLGDAASAEPEARLLREQARRRLEAVSTAVEGASVLRVLALEWLDPPFVAGHWVPEMVAIAGGEDVLGHPGERSRTATWEELENTPCDVAVVMPCGYDAERSAEEAHTFADRIERIPARRVVALDASAYISRPGPRLVTGVELLAHVLHPDRVEKPSSTEVIEVRAEGLEPPQAKPTSS